MSTSHDSTVYRRNRKLQLDGGARFRHQTGTLRSHTRPIEAPLPQLIPADVPDLWRKH